MLRRDGHANLSTWWRGMRWLWGRNGFFTRLIPVYRDYYRDDFHPWQHDNRLVMEHYANEFASGLIR